MNLTEQEFYKLQLARLVIQVDGIVESMSKEEAAEIIKKYETKQLEKEAEKI